MTQPTSEEKQDRSDQSGEHSPTLRSTVGDIAAMMTLQAAGILFLSLLFLLMNVWVLFNESTRNGLARIGCVEMMPAALVLVGLSVALFMFKVAFAFGRFEPWTSRWVVFLTRSWIRWGLDYWLVYKHLYDDDVRKAFHQSEDR